VEYDMVIDSRQLAQTALLIVIPAKPFTLAWEQAMNQVSTRLKLLAT
jgi:hypothetical protein